MTARADYLRSLAIDEAPADVDPAEAPGATFWQGLKGLKHFTTAQGLRELPDTALTLGTGMIAQPIAGLTGLASLATGHGLEQANRDIEATREGLTYTPANESGQKGMAAIGGAIEPIAKGLRENVADPVGAVSPVLGAALVALPDALPGPKGVKGAVEAAGRAAKAGKAAERGAVAAEGAAAPAGAAVRSADPATAAAGLPNDPAGKAMQAALRVIRIADDSGIHIGDRNAAFERARQAARERLNEGGTFDEAQAAAHHVTFSQPEAATPYSTPPPAPTGHERLAARIAADREARGGEPLPATSHPTDIAERVMRDLEGLPGADDVRPLVLRTVRNAVNQGASFDQAVSEARAAARQQLAAPPPSQAGGSPFSNTTFQPGHSEYSVTDRVMQQTGLHGDMGVSERTALRQRVLEAVRDALDNGRSYAQAENIGRGVLEAHHAPGSPIPGSTEAIQRERMRAAALRGENTMAGFAAAADEAPKFRDQPNWTLEDQLHAAQRAYNASPTPANLVYLREVGSALQTLDPHRADRFAAAMQQATADAAASERPGQLLHARLQAVGDARRAHEANATSANAERLYQAERQLQQHRDSRAAQRAAALREEPSPQLSAAQALDQAQTAHNANPTPETEAALQAAVDAFVREDTGRHVPGSTAAGIVDDAGGTDWTPEPAHEPPAAMSPAEVQAHDNLLRRQGEHSLAGTLTPELQQTFERRRQRLREGTMPQHIVEAINNGEISAAEAWQAARPSPLRHQQEMAVTTRGVDPGWEHQRLIPGLEPLSAAEGETNRIRRLAQLARERGIRTRELRRGDPAMNRESVEAFYEGGRDNPDMFQYGVDPVRTGEVAAGAPLEDFFEVYNQRLPDANMEVERIGNRRRRDYDDDEDIDVDVRPEYLRHGRGEPMRDRSGEWKEEPKTHEAGDVPVYDSSGNPKKVTMVEGGEPALQKYRAIGGELRRDDRGDPIYREVLSEGGERMRDEHGDYKTDAEHDQEAYYERVAEAEQEERDRRWQEQQQRRGDELRMTANEGGDFVMRDYDSQGRPSMYTGDSEGKYGAPMYQAIFNQFSHSGERIRDTGLTGINKMRMLANVNTNYARTGVNPRDISSAGYGNLPHGERHAPYAEGPEIWRSESDEALKRVQARGGKPERMAFDPELGFTLDGLPASPADLKAALPSMSPGQIPGSGGSGVSLKVLMRSAMFDWLRDANPADAARVAREWGKKYGPLFGVAGVGLTLQDALREKADEGVQ